MSVRNILYRCRFAGAGLLLLLSAGTFSARTVLADPPSHTSSNTQKVIDESYSSIKSTVKHHQNSSVIADINQTGKILLDAKTDLSKLNDPSSPGTIVGGLDLFDYCLNNGYANGSFTAVPGVEFNGGAYTWYCVAANGTQTPINMQDACIAQYPGQVTVAYPQDPNNSYSWVCIAPATGTYTDPTTGATVDSITTPTSDMTMITLPGSAYLEVVDNGNSADAIITAQIQGQNNASASQFTDIMNAARNSIFNTDANAANNNAAADNRAYSWDQYILNGQ